MPFVTRYTSSRGSPIDAVDTAPSPQDCLEGAELRDAVAAGMDQLVNRHADPS